MVCYVSILNNLACQQLFFNCYLELQYCDILHYITIQWTSSVDVIAAPVVVVVAVFSFLTDFRKFSRRFCHTTNAM